MRRFLFRLSLLLLLILAIALLTGYRLMFAPHAPGTPVLLKVEPGSSLHRVAGDLQQSDVIRSAQALKLLARWKGQSSRIQAGTYRFSSAVPPAMVLERLIRGDVEKVSLTVPEGFTLEQIIIRIAESGYGSAEKLRNLAHDRGFINSLGITADSLEGYLFPETYLFAPGIGEQELLRMMASQFRSHIGPELLEPAGKLGLDLHQLVTLASIIEKETGVVEEMPLISSVFHNRLKRGIPLQTDPTVIYGIRDFDGNITRRHLETATPYNTYLIRGLPPGPIASPGLSALQAAVRPADSNYLYFVARGDGSHQFSRTLREHNAAVRKYQLRRRN